MNFIKLKPKAAVVVFLGTNCDRDTKIALEKTGFLADYVFHTETNFKNYDLIVLPGGFSFGDYIQAGRLAKLSSSVLALKNCSKLILGICNGFQILCEAGFLPGALISNKNAKFISRNEALILENKQIPLTMPVAHKEGFFWADEKTLEKIEEKKQVLLRYKNNPNGSLNNIAGLYDKDKKIIGIMPHPERAVSKKCGLCDGIKFFNFIKNEI